MTFHNLPLEQCALALLSASQEHVRAFEKDSSAVSLRDVARCCELLGWFATKIVPREAKAKAKVSPLAASMVLALAFVYFYRLPTRAARAGYWEAMLKALVYQQFGRRDKFGESGFGGFAAEGAFERVIAGVQKRLCANVEVEDGVAMNAALSENLFVGIVAILNRCVEPPRPRVTTAPGRNQPLPASGCRSSSSASLARPRPSRCK